MIPIYRWLGGGGTQGRAKIQVRIPSARQSEIPPFRKKRERNGPPFALYFGGVSLERIRERLMTSFRDDALVVASKKFLQTVGVHGVLPGHVRDSIRRNRRDLPLPQELQDLPHPPLSGNAQQFGLRHFDALGEG